jgi:hypothetical protein
MNIDFAIENCGPSTWQIHHGENGIANQHCQHMQCQEKLGQNSLDQPKFHHALPEHQHCNKNEGIIRPTYISKN